MVSVTAHCLQCGRAVGDIGKDGKPITCLKLGRVERDLGVVCWCDDECMSAWDATHQENSSGFPGKNAARHD